jgi:glycosyltransferase involved in cell wall biosynthesis
VDKYILQNATRIIAISDQMRNYLASSRNISNEKIVVVQNWQDESVFVKFKSTNNQLAEQNRPFTFMYLGNIGPVAGIELIIDAFASANLQNCRLVIAGAGSMQKELYKKAVELNLNSIEFWSVPDGKVPEIQNKADVMLLPIKNGAASSSIPSKLPAYMFSEKPIIACVEKNSDTANALNDANCGWVLPPDNLNNLVENLKMVSQLSKEVLKIKGKNGFEYAMEHFNKRINLGKLINVINEIIPAI